MDLLLVIWQKADSQNGGNKNTKHAKFSEKRTFFGKFGVLCIVFTSVLRFALLPYYRRYNQIKEISYLWVERMILDLKRRGDQ